MAPLNSNEVIMSESKLIVSVSGKVDLPDPTKDTIKALYQKQNGECFYCGFEAMRSLKPVADEQSQSWVLCCPICYDVLNLDEAARERPRGRIIATNDFTQEQINIAMQVAWATQYHVGDDFPSTAISTVWNKLQQLTYGVEYRFGKGTSKLPVAASVLASLGEKYYEKRKTICHDLRYLPNDKDYPVFLSYWQSEVYGKYKDDIPKMEVVGE